MRTSRLLSPASFAANAGWYIRHVYDLDLAGANDATLFQKAQQLRAVVITFDEDFADARMYPARTHAGVIRLRLWPTTSEEVESALGRLLESTSDEWISGSLIVLTSSASGSVARPATANSALSALSPGRREPWLCAPAGPATRTVQFQSAQA
jgi:predicted nuclease of predicted toxin-antitoxin system